MKKAVVLSLSDDLAEMRSLLTTLEIAIVGEFVQKRTHPHRESFLGPGRLEEVLEQVKLLEPDLIVVNGILKPSQHHHLEMKFQKECLDRPGVILRIFANHAHTPEAIAQVTLAKLRYELPFLRERIHRAKTGDRPGFMAGGAYATDVHYEHARTHARKIAQSLKEFSKEREITRTRRRGMGYLLVSLAGYTNAGKSALLNSLCESDVLVDDRLFSTLSTTTRRVKGIRGTVLMTDTVGFIRNLPPDLIDAFNSTLEEIYDADVILLIFDASDPLPEMKEKLKTCLDILIPRIGDRPLILVGNKIDLLPSSRLAEIEASIRAFDKIHELLFVSAKTGQGLDELRSRIADARGFSVVIEAVLPATSESMSLLSEMHSIAEVDESFLGDKVRATIRCRKEDAERLSARLKSAGAERTDLSYDAHALPGNGLRAFTGNEGVPL